jgi:dihydroorotate dehydrogenase
LALCKEAVGHRERVGPGREFHVIRTGGVEGAEDLWRSLDEGVALCQWYTGYFEAFGRWGDGLYEKVFSTRSDPS